MATGAATPLLFLALLGVVAAGKCAFDNEPVFPGYYWDTTCMPGMLGCEADGKHVECRFCGGGDYANISCRASSCQFVNEPFVPYYWDATCKLGTLGCWADGVHPECRFCGKAPFTSIPCPDDVGGAIAAACTFKNGPNTKYGWDPSCRDGMLGCNADGVHLNCRYCEEGEYANISCAQSPAEKKCTFANEPTVPYFWDHHCTVGQLGCLADGVHPECRFCAHRPFETIPCPDKPVVDDCTFPPLRSEPRVPYYWEPTCQMGVLGCWADGEHAQCRYCGSGVYKNITCPETAAFPEGYAGASSSTGAQVAAGLAPAAASEAKQSGALSGPAEQVESARAAPASPAAAPVVAMDQKPAGEVQVNTASVRGPWTSFLLLGCIGTAAPILGAGAV